MLYRVTTKQQRALLEYIEGYYNVVDIETYGAYLILCSSPAAPSRSSKIFVALLRMTNYLKTTLTSLNRGMKREEWALQMAQKSRKKSSAGSSETSGPESVVRLIAGSVTITSLRWEGDDGKSIEDAEHLIYGHTKLKFQDQEGESAGKEDGNDLILGRTTLVTKSGHDEYLDASWDELVDETSELAVTPTKDEREDNRRRHRTGSSRKHEVQGVSTRPNGQRRRADDELGRERRNLYVPESP